MARYVPEISGPDFLKVYLEVGGVEYEVEVYVAHQACGNYYVDYSTGLAGWEETIDPQFNYEGFDENDNLLVFTAEQIRILDEKSSKFYWEKVGDMA